MSKQQKMGIEDELATLVDKLCDDFKSKVSKIVARHEKKVLSDQAKQFKTATKTTKPKAVAETHQISTKKRTTTRYDSDSDKSESD